MAYGGRDAAKVLSDFKTRLQSFDAERQPWMADWRLVEQHASSRRTRWLANNTNAWDQTARNTGSMNNRVVDGAAIKAGRILTNGIDGGMSSASQEWFTIKTADDDLMKSQNAREWLDMLKAEIYALFARTNFYPASKQGYGSLSKFGVDATIMLPNYEHGLCCYQLPIGSYRIGQNEAGQVDTLYRDVGMTVAQVVHKWGDKALKVPTINNFWTAGNYNAPIPVVHGIEPNWDAKYGAVDRTNKPYRSIYTLPQESDHLGLLDFGGFDEKPFYAPRWDAETYEAYSISPAMEAMADTKGLQLQAIRKQQAIDYIVKPALRGPATLNNTYANLNPGGITTMAGIDKAEFSPIWEINPNAINFLGQEVREQRGSVDEWFYAPLFMAITNMPGVQPRNMEEIARRNEEALQQLGPATNRIITEKLMPAVERAAHILITGGMLPPAPEELAGQPLKIEFVGILVRLQRMAGVGVIERLLSFTGNLIGVFPELQRKIDSRAALDEYADRLGAPAKVTRSEDEVDKLDAQDAAAQQAQQMAEQGAPAAVDAANAAKLLSETDMGDGTTALSRMAQGIAA